MARILGIDLPNNKKLFVGLTYIYGVGSSTAEKIIVKAGLKRDTKVADLSADEVNKIRDAIAALGIRTEGELRRYLSSSIKRLSDIRSYRGDRHRKNLPVRGQKTRANCRTRKGKSAPVGGLKRVLAKK